MPIKKVLFVSGAGMMGNMVSGPLLSLAYLHTSTSTSTYLHTSASDDLRESNLDNLEIGKGARSC